MQRQGSVKRPAGCRRPARHKEGSAQQNGGRNHQPKAKVVQPRESHVGRAYLQRNHPVCEPHKRGHDGAKHHDQTVHGGELVEQLRVDQLQARLEQFSPNTQRQHAAKHQIKEGKQQIQRADVFVVGRKNPTTPADGRTVVMMLVVRMLVSWGSGGAVGI